jgi:Response regulators consisting of a CheY-like receiver domain and a winged-helix DNA-binding domain
MKYGDIRLLEIQKPSDVHIQRIREKIEVDPKKPKRLITVRGVGYKLVNDG